MNGKLLKIQAELKAPKGKFNSFGKFKYRSCEDILEAVKPLLAKYQVTLTLTDDIIEVGGRVYVKATATLTDGAAEKAVTAFAREAEKKSGMDDSQVTGTASSYARKYALNGLFLIDDTKDADTDEYHDQVKTEEVKAETIPETKALALGELCKEKGIDAAIVCARYGVKSFTEMTEEMHAKAVASVMKSKGKS